MESIRRVLGAVALRVTYLAQLLVLVAAALGSVAASADGVAPEPFFQHDDYGELRLSPSGKYVGALVPVGGAGVPCGYRPRHQVSPDSGGAGQL